MAKITTVKIYDKETDQLKRVLVATNHKKLREILNTKVDHETERAVPTAFKSVLTRMAKACNNLCKVI